MASLNVVRRERKSAFRQVKQALRTVDTEVERAQRFIDRKLALKRNIIEAKDATSVLNLLKAIDMALRAVIQIMETIMGLFK